MKFTLSLITAITFANLCFAGIPAGDELIAHLETRFEQQSKPVTFTTERMLVQARTRISRRQQPWLSNYERVKTYATESLERPIEPYTLTDSSKVHDIAARDFCAARDCAMVWILERDIKYLNHAKEILLQWARATPEPLIHLQCVNEYKHYKSNLGLYAGVPMIFYCHAYSLIWDRFSQSERDDIDSWLRKVAPKLKLWHYVWTAFDYYGKQYFNNHLSWHNAAIAYIGFVLKDAELVAYAIDSKENPRDFKDMLAGAILMPGDAVYDYYDKDADNISPGEIYDRYRTVQGKGLDYAMYHGLALTYLAEAAYNNGIDLYSYTASGGENLLLLYKYYADFIAREDSKLKGGFYSGDSIPVHYASIYDLINTRYPGVPEIVAVLKAHGRNTHLQGRHGGTIGITHSLADNE